MMQFNKKFFIIISLLFASFIFTREVDAATLYLLPQTRNIGLGQEVSIDIKINTEETHINAAQATIQFPSSILELSSVDKTNSAFGFWAEEPKISNEEGILTFIGGTTKGITGDSLQILKMKFKAKGVGSASISINDAAVTASDGKGTNVLSTIKGTSILVSSEVVETPKPSAAPATPPPSTPSPAAQPPAPVEEPQKIVRKAVIAKKLPSKPELRVPLYPDETRWYNHLGEAVVFWNMPDDVIEVAAVLDKNPNTKPQISEKELFTGKNFGVLKEGIWYIHVRFKNNIGWGETVHYKISIDTTAPLAFEIKTDTLVSDNPSPEIRYETYDALSGISHTLIFIDKKELVQTTTTVFSLPPQVPGKHIVLARVFDLAGNSVEDDLEFEVLPLVSPTIDFITKTVSQGEVIFVAGKGIPNAFVNIQIFNTAGRKVYESIVSTDAVGKWERSIEDPLEKGKYILSVVSKDERGALSYPVEAKTRVKPKTVLSLGLIDLGWFEIFWFSLLLIAAGVGIVGWLYISKKKTLEAYNVIVGRDIDKLATLLFNQLKELEEIHAKQDLANVTKETFLIDKIKDTVARMKKYLGEEVRKLK